MGRIRLDRCQPARADWLTQKRDFVLGVLVIIDRIVLQFEALRALLLDQNVDRDTDFDLVPEDVAALPPSRFARRAGVTFKIDRPKLVEIPCQHGANAVEAVLVQERRIADKC